MSAFGLLWQIFLNAAGRVARSPFEKLRILEEPRQSSLDHTGDDGLGGPNWIEDLANERDVHITHQYFANYGQNVILHMVSIVVYHPMAPARAFNFIVFLYQLAH